VITVVATTSHHNALSLVMKARLFATEPCIEHVMVVAVEVMVVEMVVAVIVEDPVKAPGIDLVVINMAVASMPHPN